MRENHRAPISSVYAYEDVKKIEAIANLIALIYVNSLE
jgi:hypothetical protein